MRKILFTVAILILASSFAFSDGTRDFASEVRLSMGSGSAKQEVTVHTFVDGDTTHFNVPASISENGVLKVRYIAVNTPESTGRIEEYGKKASAFTRGRLEGASSIIIESDTGSWNPDSTGGRFLCWVWYRSSEDEPYRNLNIEILQNGLAIAQSTANNRYGAVASAALAHAKERKLNIYSGQKDPDFYYGAAIELTLKELRCNVASYNGMKVAYKRAIKMNDGSSVYMEDYDEETGLLYGISVFYGYNLPGKGLDVLTVGNRSRIVGTVQYYEVGGVYQVAGLQYKQMKPKDPGNIQKIDDGNLPVYALTDARTFTTGKVTLSSEDGGETKTFDHAYLALDTSIEMHGLTVKDIHTTDDPSSSSYGAMTMTCESEDGYEVAIRTAVLRDPSRNLITADAYLGKRIDVRGVVEHFQGSYQIKVLGAKDIIIE